MTDEIDFEIIMITNIINGLRWSVSLLFQVDRHILNELFTEVVLKYIRFLKYFSIGLVSEFILKWNVQLRYYLVFFLYILYFDLFDQMRYVLSHLVLQFIRYWIINKVLIDHIYLSSDYVVFIIIIIYHTGYFTNEVCKCSSTKHNGHHHINHFNYVDRSDVSISYCCESDYRPVHAYHIDINPWTMIIFDRMTDCNHIINTWTTLCHFTNYYQSNRWQMTLTHQYE